jgi:hypothetical protein
MVLGLNDYFFKSHDLTQHCPQTPYIWGPIAASITLEPLWAQLKQGLVIFFA